MSVLDKLPSGEPLRVLREQEQLIKEIKAPQTLGNDSVITHRIFSASVYDLSIAGGDTHDVLIEFIPDDLAFGGALCYELVVVANPEQVFRAVAIPDRLRVVNGVQQWKIFRTSTTAVTYKFYFFTAGSGTFTTNLV